MSSSSTLYIVTEAFGADIYDLIYCRRADLDRAFVAAVAAGLASALAHCHEYGFAHRNVKPENVLVAVTAEPRSGRLTCDGVRLCDFGLTVEVVPVADSDGAGGRRFEPLTDFCGSNGFFAPELITKSYDGPAADMWSFGCVLLELVTTTGAAASSFFRTAWCERYYAFERASVDTWTAEGFVRILVPTLDFIAECADRPSLAPKPPPPLDKYEARCRAGLWRESPVTRVCVACLTLDPDARPSASDAAAALGTADAAPVSP